MSDSAEIQRQAASFVAWLDMSSCQQLMRLLFDESFDEAETFLGALFPDLPADLDLASESWSEAVLSALENRVAPPDEWDRAPTELMPDYTRYAHDVRAS